MRRLLILVAAAAAWACSNTSHDMGELDAGCATPCGSECCGAGQLCLGGQCVQPDAGVDAGPDCVKDPCACCTGDQRCIDGTRCCTPSCTDKECGDDGCGDGTQCGDCVAAHGANWTCDTSTFTCTCAPQSDRDFCAAHNQFCGLLTAKDSCGRDRTDVDCSVACEAPSSCHADGACRCDPETEAALCGRLGKACGLLTATDNCGQTRTDIDCSVTCAAPKTCHADGTCSCDPETDAALCGRLQKACGLLTATDTCGATRTDVDCSVTCAAPKTCHADATCRCDAESDTAFCARLGKQCGAVSAADNCGAPRAAQCGSCATGLTCDATSTCVCVPESDTAFCARMATQCGEASGTDNCGQPRAVTDCGTCSSIEVCASRHCFVCTQETDAQLCSRLGAYCDPLAAMDNCGVPRTPSCGTCTGPLTCQANHACGNGTAPTNDTCAQPELLQLTGTGTLTATVHGDTSLATNDQTLPCNSEPTGNDLVYKLTVPPGGASLQLSVTPSTGSLLRPSVALRSSCGAGPDVVCGNSTTPTASLVLAARNLAPGDYYLWIDGWGPNDIGAFDLRVTLTPGTPPPSNDSCSAPQTLVFAGATATASGDNTSAVDDYSGTCGTMDGGDLVYSFELLTASAVTATVVRDPGAPALKPAVIVRSTCASGASADQLACALETNGLVRAKASYLAPGTYYVVADSTAHTFGAFSLQVEKTPPLAGDACANAMPILIDPLTGLGSITGDTTAAVDDAAGSCRSGSSGPDLVYSFTVAGSSAMKAEIEVIPSSPNFVPLISLRAACDQQSSELGCVEAASSASTRLIRSHLTPGTYYLWVDGNGAGSSGAFAVNITLGQPPTPPANDLCSQPAAIALTAAGATLSGTTVGAIDDSQGGCATSGAAHSGGDVVYRFTLGSAQNVAVSVTRAATSPSFRPALYLRSDCADGATQLACGGEAGGSAGVRISTLAAGTYYLIVDGVAGTEGDFTLAMATYPSTFTNDSCAAPMALSFDANGDAFAAGDTTPAASDSLGSSSGRCPGSGLGGDLVYSFTLTTPKNVTITQTPAGNSLEPVLYVRKSSCASTAALDEVGCSDPGVAGGQARVALRNLAAGTYWIWADSNPWNTGPFILQVHASQPPQLASNDTCSAPTALAPPSTLTGDLDLASGNYDGSCRAGSGFDVVYSLSLPRPQALTFTVTPTTTALRPVVYLQTACGGTSATEKGCSYATAAGAAATLTFPVLAAGTYYLVVDSYSVDETGPFTLETVVGSTPPPPPANDVCAGATALTWTGTTAEIYDDTGLGNDEYVSYCSIGTTRLTGPDLVYSFTLGSPAQVTATATRVSTNTTYKPAVSIRTSCAASDEIICARDVAGASSVTVSLNAGTFYVFVDGVGSATSGSAFGAFALRLSQGTAIPADGCGNPAPIAIDPLTGIGTASGTTVGATNSGDGSCNTASGVDLVYALTLPADMTVQVSLANPTGSTALYPNVYLRRTCSDPASELGCDFRYGATTPASFTVGRVPAGTSYIWVDSYSMTYSGPFVLTVTATTPGQPAPTNEGCSAPQVLVIDGPNGGAQAVGDTRWALNDYGANCQSASAPFTGPDVVYSFTLTQAETIYAGVSRAPGAPSSFSPALYLRTTCSDQTTEIACATNTAAASINQVLQPGTYYLFVDGQKGSAGGFVLNVSGRATTAMTNDTCATAQPLTFDANGLALAAGSTAGTANDATGSCYSSSAAGDVVYSFTLAASKMVTVDLNPAALGMFPMVYVQSACGSASTEKGCAYTFSYGGVELSLGRMAAGTYYVFVDEPYATYTGPFVLSVRADPPPPAPVNDSCRTPTFVAIDSATGKGSVTGDTQPATDDEVSFCSTGIQLLTGPDLVYSFTLSSSASVTAKVTRDASNTVYMPAVSIRSSCSFTDEVVCALPSNGVATATATLTAGSYLVFVDGVSSTTAGSTYGPFTLELSTSAAVPGDSCGSAIPLTIDPSTGIATATGDLNVATKSADGSCAQPTGSDMVYSLTLPADKAVTVTVANPSGLTGLSPIVYMRRVCADPMSEKQCAFQVSSAPASFAINRLNAGTYFIWVDCYMTNQGPFVLTVRTANPQQASPANDLCAAAQALTLDPVSHAAHVSGDTTWAADDYAGTCAPSSTFPMSGPDVVYSVTLSQPATLYALVNKDPAEANPFYPSVYLRSACASPAVADELACGSAPGSMSASFTKVLPAGTYWLIVDGQKGLFGKFLLDLVARPNTTMTNDRCGAELAIALDATGSAVVAGTTSGMTNDGAGSCGSSSAPDVVYSLTTSGPKSISIDLMGGAGFSPAVYVRTSCSDSATQVACDLKTSSGVPAHVDLLRKPAGTYYIWVDGFSNTSGLFTMEVRAVDPTGAPAHDVCSGAQPITLPAIGAAPLRLTDSTLNSANDYTGTCATATAPFDGPDNVYAFTAGSTVMVVAKVTPASAGLKPAVYIRDVCAGGSGTEKCAYNSSPGPLSPAITAQLVSAGTWYIVVDGVSGTAGDYTLEVTTTNYTGVTTATAVYTFTSAANAYGMTVDSSELIYDNGSMVYSMPLSGAAPTSRLSVGGYDVAEANGSIFELDTSTSNTAGRLWQVKDAASGWLASKIRWDVPSGTTTSSWPSGVAAYAMTFDGTDLIVATGGTSSASPVSFYAVSPAQAELPRALGPATTSVYYVRGLAADQSYFYVMGLSTVSTTNASLWRFDRSNLAAPPVELFRTSGFGSSHTPIRLDSLTAPHTLYVRPYTSGSAIHAVLNPAGPSPLYIGSLGLPGVSANYNFNLAYDRVNSTLYYIESATNSNGVLWKVQ